LQVLQNRALKLVFGLPPLTNTLQLFQTHAQTILPIKGLHELLVLKHVKQIMNHEVLHLQPLPFNTGIGNLRDNLKLNKKKVCTDLGKRQMSYIGPHYFNQLPFDIRQIHDTLRFCKEVKKHLLQHDNLQRFF
jgi:hypothetical protein